MEEICGELKFSKLRKIISEKGTEYTSMQFNKFCVDEGVDHQLTVGYTPQ